MKRTIQTTEHVATALDAANLAVKALHDDTTQLFVVHYLPALSPDGFPYEVRITREENQ